MANQPDSTYTESFADIANWSDGFTSGIGATHFAPVTVNATGTIPNGTRITTATTSFVTGFSGGVQKGNLQATSSQSIVLLSTGATDNTTSTAIDFLADFSGVNAGILSFDWASLNNNTGDRKGSLRVYYSVNNITYTELTSASVLNFTNNSPASGSIVSVALPAPFNNSASARLRFYYYNGMGGSSGSRPKISIDNIKLTAVTNGSMDTTPPILTSLYPPNGSGGVPVQFTAIIHFNENIRKNTGSIHVKQKANGSTVQTINITSPAVVISNNTVNFPVASLANNTDYYFEIDGSAFEDVAGNKFAGIAGNNTWAFTTTAPPADGMVGSVYNFNRCSNYITAGFQTFSVSGLQTWNCTRFGRTYPGTGTSMDSAIQISGFAGTAQANEDWLISPKFDLSGTTIPLLQFYSRTAFAGKGLKLKVSSNYAGSGSPAPATWTDLNGRFPEAGSDGWTLSDSINLSAFNGSTAVYVAWVYTSSTTAAARWTLDDIMIYSSTALPMPNLTPEIRLLDFGTSANGSSSVWKGLFVAASDFTSDVTFTAPAGFGLSKDSSVPLDGIVYTAAEINAGGILFYIRFNPTVPNQTFAGNITAASANYSSTLAELSGNSYLMSNTLDVVNWNIEWFGATGTGFGPVNKDLQEINVKTILRNLNADLYAFSEIVDTNRLKRVTDSLGSDFGYAVADYGSYATDASDPDYAGAQKNGFIFNKNIFSNITTRGLLRHHAVAQDSVNAAYWWASGRFPYLLNANVTLGGVTRNMNFIVIHAKANTGNPAEQIEAYERRKLGAHALKDTLDLQFPNARIILLGDFNDDLDRTIAPTTGADTLSSYQVFVADSVGDNHYGAPTLALSLKGASSTASFPNVIDHVILSNEMKADYISRSAAIKTDVAALVTNYANTTSDHYPVLTRYFFQSNEAVLPVKLTSFDAKKVAAGVLLSWTTAEELNANRFVVQRSSSTRSWSAIGTLPASGTSGLSRLYTFTDTAALKGSQLYRLLTIDLDGSTSSSAIIHLNFNETRLTLHPNPVKHSFTISNSFNEPVYMEVVHLSGEIMKKGQLQAGTTTISATGWAKGVYLVRLFSTEGAITRKLVID